MEKASLSKLASSLLRRAILVGGSWGINPQGNMAPRYWQTQSGTIQSDY